MGYTTTLARLRLEREGLTAKTAAGRGAVNAAEDADRMGFPDGPINFAVLGLALPEAWRAAKVLLR